MYTINCSCYVLLLIVVWAYNVSTVEAQQVVFNFTVPEEQPTNTFVGSLGPGSYSIIGSSDLFTISGTELRTAKTFDRENGDRQFSILLRKFNVNILKVNVLILDINDNIPVFPSSSVDLKIGELTGVGRKFSLHPAKDKDFGQNGTVVYRIASGDDGDTFGIRFVAGETSSLDLVVNKTLDRETVPRYSLNLSACDNGHPRLCGFCVITVNIEDANDNAPLFNPTRYTGNITENSATGTSILKVYASDPDLGTNGKIKYSIDTSTDPGRKFGIGESDGVIVNNVKLDFELEKEYNIIVIAADSGNTPKTNIAHVKIHIIDQNDNAPEVEILYFKPGSHQLLENAPVGTNVARLSVSDKDSGINAKTDIKLKNTHDYFALQKQSGSENVYLVSINKTIDREKTSQVTLTVLAEDRGTPPKSFLKSFYLNIGDVNDNAPRFLKTPYLSSVNESVSVGKSVYRVQADDSDIGTNAKIVYSIIADNIYSSWFTIGNSTGIVSASNGIDREKSQTAVLNINAMDSGVPSKYANTTITFTVLDSNDNAPYFESSYTFSVLENTTATQNVGTVLATDLDTTSLPISYSISGSNNFHVNSRTGLITTSHVLDREKKGNETFTVFATDVGGLRGNVTVLVIISDINDNNPYFSPVSYNISVHENTPVGIPVLYVTAKDDDIGDNAKVVFKLSSCEPCSVFSLNTATGGLYPTSALNYNAQNVYNFMVSAKDSKGLPAINSAAVRIHVLPAVDAPPKFESSSYTFYFAESNLLGSFVGKVVAKRDNFGVGELFEYSFVSGIQNSSFSINRSGIIVTNKIIDYETKRSYSARIQAKIIGSNLTANANLVIVVLDINDNAPSFNASSFELNLKEGVPLGFSVFTAFASDIDSGSNGVVSYSFKDKSPHFNLNSTSGLISTKSLIDYETNKHFELVIVAADNGNPRKNSSLLLKVNITDINDNPPQFSRSSYFVNVAENAAIGYHFFTLNVSDVDSGANGQFVLSFKPDQYSDLFSLSNDGQVRIAKELDRETKTDYPFVLIAKDKGYPQHTSQAKLTIIVTDINDNKPSFGVSSYLFTVCEEQPPGTFVKALTAVDKDEGSNGIVTYKFQPASNYFAINSVTGAINTKVKLDRESSRQIYNLIVNASDGGIPSKSSLVEVKISLCDINDNAPEFSRSSPYSVSIVKTTSSGTNIMQVHAVDKDLGLSSSVTYSLLGTLPDEIDSVRKFSIDSSTGWIKTASNFELDTKILHSFSVVAKDSGVPQRVSIKKVLVFLLEGNKVPVIFQSYDTTVIIKEETAMNTAVYTVKVAPTNIGAGKTWAFSIVKGNNANSFQLNSTSGILKVSSPLSYENTKSFQLKIAARDLRGIDSTVGVMYINIYLLDRNQRWPVFASNPIILGFNENLSVGSVVLQASATDADIEDNGRVIYSLISQGPGSPIFNINAFNGKITTTQALDREKVSEWTIILKAEDTAVDVPSRHSATATIKLLVFDINDNKPEFISKNYSYMMEDERVGYPVTRIVAKDADQGSNAAIVYSIDAGNELGKFRINSATGEITLAKKLSYNEQSSYTLKISVSDSGKPALTNAQLLKIEIIDVNNNSPKFITRQFTARLTEGSSVGTKVVQVKATDLDSGTNGKVIYSLEANDHFAINKSDGWISTKAEIDREKWPSYQLSLSADNDAWPFHSDTAILRITVDDINDCAPVFVDGASVNVTVFENLAATLVHRFFASDCDSGTNAAVRYSITQGDTRTFSLDATSGFLYTAKELDRENITFYEVVVQAKNIAPPYQLTKQTAKIWVGDLNDNRPVFSRKLYSKIIPENSALGLSVLDVRAVDQDAGLNGQVVYSIVRNKSLIPFDINPASGNLYVTGRLDYETQRGYNFEVKASDLSPYGNQRSFVRVQINVSDINDNPPIFSSPIFEGNTTSSIKIFATDIDSGSNGIVRYKFAKTNNLFSIDIITGEVTFRSLILGRYKLQVEAYDLGSPSLSSFATLIINEGSSILLPKFLNKSASVRIPENSAVNSQVGKMVARSSSSAIKYDIEFSPGDDASAAPFKVDENTGVVSVNNPALLDYEKVKWFELVIRASINRNDSLSTYEKLRINLTDVNDNSPVIYPKNDDISLPEAVESESQVAVFVKQFTATDADSGQNGKIVLFSILSGNEDDVFKIHADAGVLLLQKNLDFERKRVHRLEIQAKDGGMPPRYRSTRLTVHVIDKNDNAPIFNKYGIQKISESARPGLPICIVKAEDPDRSSTITYSLKPEGNIRQYFYIDQTQGLIKLLKKLDFETTKLYKLVVFASDGKHTSNMTLLAEVEDANDNAPVFSQPGYVVYLPKIVQPNHMIIRLNATDKDSGSFGTVRYSIPYPPIDAFLIDQNSGMITSTKKIILNDLNRPYELLVFAKDGGQPQLQTQTRVHLRVKDPNYTGPKYDKSIYPKTKAVFESVPIGALIETVSVTSRSEIPGMQIEYSIQAGNEDKKFYIDPLYGKILLVNMLDRENVSRYTLVVRATDKGKPPQYDDATLNVRVVDANDNSPVFEKREYVVSVLENVTQGTHLLTVNATDADDPNPKIGNGIIAKYSISSGNSLNWFEINSKGVLTLIRLLDRESKSVHRLTVKATDNGQPNVRSGFTSVVIKLIDVNDNRPEFTIPNIKDLEVLENSKEGKLVFKASAEDRDQGRNGLVTYSIIDGNGRDYFQIDNATGWVTTKGTVIDYETQNLYKLRILAVDHGTVPLSSSFEYRVVVKDVNEYTPEFVQKSFMFSIRGDAKEGAKIGQINATDKDGGSWGKVYYSLVGAPKKIRIESDTGSLFVESDLRTQDNRKRKRRAAEDDTRLSFVITANNGPNTKSSTVPLILNVDYSCTGCSKIASVKSTSDSSLKGVPLVLVITFGSIIAILLVFIVVFCKMLRRRQSKEEPKETKEPSDTKAKHEDPPPTTLDSDFSPPDLLDGYHPSLFKQPSIGASSGRGSSESQLLGGSHRPSFTATDNGSTHSFVVYHDNKPVLDSGIVGDFDRLSDVTISDIAPSSELHFGHTAEVASSVGSSFGRKHDVSSSLSRKLRKGIASSTQSESHDSLNDFMDEGGGEEAGRLDFGNLLYTKLAEVDADEQEAVMDGTRPFTDEGIPSRGGSLSTIVGSDEELRGNYNWDYLLDWGPQFQPLATVFSEIAKVQGSDRSEQSKAAMSRPAALNRKGRPVNADLTRPEPIPLQNLSKKVPVSHTESADSKLGSLKTNNRRDVNHSNLISNRTSMLSSFSSLPRSPMSAQSSYTSGPLSPNFTPAITPLITRSPSVSPLETPGIASPIGSKPTSVLDLAEKSRKLRGFKGTRQSEQSAPSDHNSEVEISV